MVTRVVIGVETTDWLKVVGPAGMAFYSTSRVAGGRGGVSPQAGCPPPSQQHPVSLQPAGHVGAWSKCPVGMGVVGREVTRRPDRTVDQEPPTTVTMGPQEAWSGLVGRSGDSTTGVRRQLGACHGRRFTGGVGRDAAARGCVACPAGCCAWGWLRGCAQGGESGVEAAWPPSRLRSGASSGGRPAPPARSRRALVSAPGCPLLVAFRVVLTDVRTTRRGRPSTFSRMP